MSVNFNPGQGLDTAPTLTNPLVTQTDSSMDKFDQRFASIFQSSQAQNQSLQAQDHALQELSQHLEEHNKQTEERLDQLIVHQERINETHTAMIEKMEVVDSYQQGTLNILNGIARLFWPFGRRRPELPAGGPPAYPAIALPPHPGVVIEEIPADAELPLPRAEETKIRKFIRFVLWISTPIRRIFRFVLSNLYKLAQKIGLIRGNTHQG